MSKSMNPFAQQQQPSEKKSDSQVNWVPFGGGGWSFPGNANKSSASIQPENANQSPVMMPPMSQFGQATQSSPSPISSQQSPYPQPIILMAPPWHAPTSNQSAANPTNHFSVTNETDNLQVTIINQSRKTITAHLVGKGTKFSFLSSDNHELSINIVAGNSGKNENGIRLSSLPSGSYEFPMNIGNGEIIENVIRPAIVAQVDNDPFNLRSLRQ